MRNERFRQREDLRRAEEAAQWLYELRTHDAGKHPGYLEWLLESPRNVEAFLRVSTLDASLHHLDPQRLLDIESQQDDGGTENVIAFEDPIPQASREPRSVALHGWRIAAGIALLGLVGSIFWMTSRTGLRSTDYQTAVGEQRAIALEDGSLLHLNTRSRVEVRYSGAQRSVRLIEGEALFRVQKDPARPFRVLSGGAVIEVLGTQFNVQRRAAESKISVIDGRVRVDHGARDTRTDAGKPVILTAGEEVRVTDSGRVAALGRADLGRVNAWRQRRLVFVRETLGSMAAEFNRYNRTLEIVAEGAAADMHEYEAMSFNADDAESFLAVLKRDPGLEIERREGQAIIRKRSPR